MRWLPLVLCCTLAACAGDEAREATRGQVPRARPGKLAKQRTMLLREHEAALRSRLEPAEQPPWIDASGADPYRIVARQTAPGFVGILRGAKALVTLDPELAELQRVTLSESPTALCTSNDTAWVASRYSPELTRVDLAPAPRILTSLRLDVAAIADLACSGSGPLHVLAADGSALLTLDASGRVLDRRPALPGGLRLVRRGPYLLEVSLFERALRLLELDARGVPRRELGRIAHDGPIWAVDALQYEAEVLIAVAGVEDKPLVRAHGEFENIDSFVWLYRFGSQLERVAELNVSDHGLVVPKAVGLSLQPEGVMLTTLASGSGQLLRATWSQDLRGVPALATQPVPPGVSDAVIGSRGIAYGSPLLDAWIHVDSRSSRLVRVDRETRPDPTARLGEALFFTELMAPEANSAGSHSRFSCETCHFEGGVDARLHYTGRADVSVVTKPLFGLANNRPHFSRALDPDLSSVCHSEFRVAGAGSAHDPWFSLTTARFPWLHELGIDAGQLGPLALRAALLRFLYEFSHAPNPYAPGRSRFSALELAGARQFRRYCSDCHAARLISDDASSAVAFEDWERLVLRRNAPIVWARGDYEKTGIVPYVHERGTRITSLRRLLLKPRYFTNGSAADLTQVLARFRFGPAGGLHEAQDAVDASPLPVPAQRQLLAFLRLL
ncbi:MAG TPA: hypothetical protein VJN18_25625 [Polyangiaceae bacterium]|nr:hypothetical protein [Polyangiaceae bacterium]